MKTVMSALLLLPLALVACVAADEGDDGSGMGSGSGSSGTTKVVSIDVVDAVISPGMANKEAWDGIGTIPSEVWSGLTAALGAPQPYSAVITFFGDQLIQQLDNPEPFGTAELLSQSSPDDGVSHVLATTTSNQEDTLIPLWPTPGRWSGVSVTSDLRVRVTLFDEDLSNHDPIGVVELNSQDIEDAIRAGQVFHARVTDQGNGQILFIGLSVRQTGTTQ
jgi:hypothetical protein